MTATKDRLQLIPPIMTRLTKFSPVWDRRSTRLEWLSITRDLDLDLGSGHAAYGRASLIDLYLSIYLSFGQGSSLLWTHTLRAL